MALPAVNAAYIKTPAGVMRIIEVGVAICGIISLEEGAYCINDSGRYSFYRFVVIATLLEAVLIIVLLLMRVDQHRALRIFPILLFINDSVLILFYFIAANLMMLSIGGCPFGLAARVSASLFSIVGTILMVGLSYTDYLWVKGESPTATDEEDESPATQPQMSDTAPPYSSDGI